MKNYKKLTDIELIASLKEGDKMAYTEIYHRFFSLLYLFVHKKIKDQDAAKDIVQEVFANIWIKRENLVFSSTLPSYLYASIRNKMLDHIGRKGVENKYLQSLQDFIDQDQVMSDHLVREKQLSQLIEQEINALPTKMREVFLLSRKHNLTYKEIADQLDLSEQTVRSHVKHALRILRNRLGLFVYLVYFFKTF